jgi:aryl-alcohol dehydrogenase-like predicted oxidoreductase
LNRLSSDYIDLIFIHEFDPITPLEESLRCIEDLIRAGDVRYFGLSNFASYQVAIACGISDRLSINRPACVQFRYNLLDRDVEVEILPSCRALKVGGIAYNVLAGGLLTGVPPEDRPQKSRLKSNDRYMGLYLNDRNLRIRRNLMDLCNEISDTIEAISLQWVLQQPTIASCLIGATSSTQLDQILHCPSVPLNASVSGRIDTILSETANHVTRR